MEKKTGCFFDCALSSTTSEEWEKTLFFFSSLSSLSFFFYKKKIKKEGEVSFSLCRWFAVVIFPKRV
jgi:hypothetical protein